MRPILIKFKTGIYELYKNLFVPKRPIYVFHHIPKSGGTSVRYAISKWFKVINDYRPTVELTPDTLKYLNNKLNIEKYDSSFCIVGHYELPGNFLMERYPQVFEKPDEFKIFSIFREPFELAISLYYHKLKTENKESRIQPLEDFLSEISNYTANRIRSNKKNYQQVLKRYFFIGVCEYMQESLDHLASLLNKPTIIIPHLNKSSRDLQSKNIPTKVKETFKKNNELDYLIYDYVLNNLRLGINAK